VDELKPGQRVIYHDGALQYKDAVIVGRSQKPKVIPGLKNQPADRAFGNQAFPGPWYDVTLPNGQLIEWVPQATEDMATKDVHLGGVVLAV